MIGHCVDLHLRLLRAWNAWRWPWWPAQLFPSKCNAKPLKNFIQTHLLRSAYRSIRFRLIDLFGRVGRNGRQNRPSCAAIADFGHYSRGNDYLLSIAWNGRESADKVLICILVIDCNHSRRETVVAVTSLKRRNSLSILKTINIRNVPIIIQSTRTSIDYHRANYCFT